jgi:hypothetical protein
VSGQPLRHGWRWPCRDGGTRTQDAAAQDRAGRKSLPYLRLALDELEAILPRARRIEFHDLDHQGPDQSEQPLARVLWVARYNLNTVELNAFHRLSSP